MLVSKTSKIPDKEIYEIIGPVSVKVLEIEKWAQEKFALQLLEREVGSMGGNALINFTVKRVGFALKNTYSGIAVVAGEIRPFWETVYCGKCGMPNKRYYEYCMHCGKKK